MQDADGSMPRRDRQGPLRGVTVIDITRVVAGPFCAMLLADLGATVIKVEDPRAPDYAREFPPLLGEGESRFSGFFAQYNRGKLGMTLNLREEEGKQLLRELVRQADVLVENFRAGTMDRLGVGYESLRRQNPALVYTALSGFGQSGPSSNKPAYDNSGQATGGLWAMNGYPDRPPVRVGTIIGDLSASLYGTIGTLAALREVEGTGRGQMVDISQQDAVFSLTENAIAEFFATGTVPTPLGNDHPFVRPYGAFPCKDGHVFFGGYTDKFWRESCEIFGTPEHAEDEEIDTMEKRFHAEVYARRVKPIVETWFADNTKAELEEMAGSRIPLNSIKDIGEAIEDPQIKAREMVVEAEYPGGTVGTFGLPVKLTATPGEPRGLAPTPGQHNELIYRRWLGKTEEEYRDLVDRGVI